MEKHLWTSLVVLGLHFCRVSGKNQVEQNPPSLITLEGKNCTIQCNYTVNPFGSLRWYKHSTGTGPASLIGMTYSDSKKSYGSYTVTLDANSKQSSLHITAAQLSDSASYICVVSATYSGVGSQLTFGKGTKLLVTPNVQDPDPSVYQMRSPKTGRTVCLFTDFDSQADFQKPEGATVISLNSSVLDMKVMDSKSNGALTWNSETNIECKENFQQPFYPSSNYSCDAKLIEKSFETDMDLNFYNLLVIGLRILLLKVIGFNLFMTLRLWSC